MPVVLGRELFVNSVVALDFDRGELRLTPSKDFIALRARPSSKLKREARCTTCRFRLAAYPQSTRRLTWVMAAAISLSKEYQRPAAVVCIAPPHASAAAASAVLHEIKRVTLPKVEVGVRL